MVRPKISREKSNLSQVWVLSTLAILICIIWISLNLGGLNLSRSFKQEPPPVWHPTTEKENQIVSILGVPEYVLMTLDYIRVHQKAPEGYFGGRQFQNRERKLPILSQNGESIRYKEWDVKPLKPGKNRGPERLVTGSDGSAWYTMDHYRTFEKIDN